MQLQEVAIKGPAYKSRRVAGIILVGGSILMLVFRPVICHILL